MLKRLVLIMRKQPGFVLLNIAGLTIGITCFLLIAFFVIHELRYDRFHKNHENIYRVKLYGQAGGSIIDNAFTPAPMAQALLNEIPEITDVTRLIPAGDCRIDIGDNVFEENGVFFADSTFFDVFDFSMLEGNPETALTRPRSIVITDEYSRKYFGDLDPLNQSFTLITESDTGLYTVTGIIKDIPSNSHLKFDLLVSMSSIPYQVNNQYWGNNFLYTYFEAVKTAREDAIEIKLKDFIVKHFGAEVERQLGISYEDFLKSGNSFQYMLEPIRDIHFYGASQNAIESPGSITMVHILFVISILILLVAVVNYINLATARSAFRSKEIGVRKVLGESKPSLIRHFLFESVVLVAISSVIALILANLFSPVFNQLISKELTAGISNLSWHAFIIILVLVVGVLAGFYPAFVLASFKPVDVLKRQLTQGPGSRNLRRILVVFQYSVSIIAIAGTLVIYIQTNYMKDKDPGFNRNNLLIINKAEALQIHRETFREQILHINGVEEVGFSTEIPGKDFTTHAFYKVDDPDTKSYSIEHNRVSFDYPEVLGVQLTQGRFFSENFGRDSSSVLINEAAVNYMDIKAPVIGKYLLDSRNQEFKIIGVMENFNTESLHTPVLPVCFTVLPYMNREQYATIRLSGRDMTSIINAVENEWHKLVPDNTFEYFFFDDLWDSLYVKEVTTGKVFIVFSVLAIIIASLGLTGLVTYMAQRRKKEMGIRKVYGASARIIYKMLLNEVVLLALIASLIAWPAVYFALKYWMASFSDKVNINPLIYIISTLLVAGISVLTVSYQNIRLAGTNPVDSLRYE